jgi:hypothetical protein
MKTINQNIFKTLPVLLTLILSLLLSTPASAIAPITNYSGEDFYIEEILTISPEKKNSAISTYSSEQTKTATKTYKIKNSSGNTLGTFTLKGTFSYGTGAPAKCTSATYSTTVNNSSCKFTAKAAYTSNNQAIGTFTFSYTQTNITKEVSQTLNITCAVNGDIS